MKFRDLLTVTENKKNKQISLNIKKKKLKKLGCSVDDLLNMKLRKKILK